MSEPVEIRVLVDDETQKKLAALVKEDPRVFAARAGEILKKALSSSP
jgi:hypothetical protein